MNERVTPTPAVQARRRSSRLLGHLCGPLAMALLLLAVLASLVLRQFPDGRLHVAYLDVGQGDAIFIRTSAGQQLLIDGGPSPIQLASSVGRLMPFWDRSLDLVVLTHPDDDHMAGLVPLFQRYRVEATLISGATLQAPEALQWCEAVEQAGVPVTVAERGLQIDLGPETHLKVLHPPAQPASVSGSENDYSVVLHLEHGMTSFLLTGDLEASGEQALMESGQTLAASVLKVSHHGSGGASTDAFLSAVNPQLAIIQVGESNLFGHPSAETLERLHNAGAQTLRTDQDGTIEIVSDGQRISVETSRH